MAANAQRAQGKIMMVGSLPFETVEEGLRAVGSNLGADVTAIPDGEVGPRKMWCMFLASDTYSKHPDLVETRRPSPAIVSNEAKPVGTKKTRPGTAPEYHWTFQVKKGVKDLDFGELGYVAAARHSYAIFRRLRDEGVIAKGVRFQVSLVATDSGEPTSILMTLTTGQWFTRRTTSNEGGNLENARGYSSRRSPHSTRSRMGGRRPQYR